MEIENDVIESAKSKLNLIAEALGDEEKLKEVQIDIVLINKSSQRKQKYKGYVLQVKKENVRTTILDILRNTCNIFDTKTIENYDLEISADDTIQVVTKENVVHAGEVNNTIDLVYEQDNVINSDTNLDSINFMLFHIGYGDDSICFYSKYIHYGSAFKKAVRMVLSDGYAIPFTKQIITINSNVDAVYINDHYFVFNRNAFNSIFDYKDVFYKIIDKNTDEIKNSGLLTEAEEFISNCQEDGRHLKRLTKAILADGFKNVKNHKDKLNIVKQRHNLSLEWSEDGKIIYKGKENIREILNLLLDHYVTSDLTERSMLAKAIEKYE